MLTLADVIEGLTEYRWEAAQGQPISQVVIDSRQAIPGSLFVALPGEHADGHDYVADAFQRGAIAALVHRPAGAECWTLDVEAGQIPESLTSDSVSLPICLKVADSLKGLQQLATYWRARFNPRVVGITGSVGKSTTKELTWAVLRQRFNTLKSPGNLNNEIGLPLTVLRLDHTHERVVLEMGMYNLGEISQLCAIARPQIGVITNVGPTHLERLGTIERIAQAKAELVQALPADGTAILNQDDPFVHAMAQQTQARVFTYGLTPEADLWASDIESEGLEGIRFVLHHQSEMIHVKVPLLGRHSVHTALRATAVGLVEEMSWQEILSGLQDSSVQLRLVSAPGINGSTLLDDTYNASPVSNIAALNLLDDLTGRKIAVLGDMAELGDQEEEGHRRVGCRAATTVDLLVTVGARAHMIAEEARACGLAPEAITEVETNKQAIEHLRQIIQPGDIVLVKGSRSMAMEEIVAALQVRI
ncbi:MAG: UDP-N-acetylmuramoyl-tripeptide--D-alanyl-D-alanine ligase [Anaerolineae bacterium]